MRLKCAHGYFLFQETGLGQVSDWMNLTGLKLVPTGSQYTFEALGSVPDFSIKGGPFMGATATKTFEGSPSEVFEANRLVYDFSKGLVVPIDTVSFQTSISLAGNRYTSPGLIVPGSMTKDGKRVRDYAAWFSRDRLTWLYSEVGFV